MWGRNSTLSTSNRLVGVSRRRSTGTISSVSDELGLLVEFRVIEFDKKLSPKSFFYFP